MLTFISYAIVAVICVLYGIALMSDRKPKIDGRFICTKDEDGNDIWKLDLDFDPKELKTKEYVTFMIYVVDENGLVLKTPPIMQKNKKGGEGNE